MEEYTFGAVLSEQDSRDYAIAGTVGSYPSKFMLKRLPAIKNQGSVGSCVAHSMSYICEYFGLQNFSTGFVYGFRPTGYYTGVGMMHRDALKTILNYGDCLHDDYSVNEEMPNAMNNLMAGTTYEKQGNNWWGSNDSENPTWGAKLAALIEKAAPYKVLSYARVRTADEAKTALMAGMPLVASVSITNSKPNSKGILSTGSTSTNLHSMCAWGWDTIGGKEYLYLSNSWGTSWGKKGFCYISFDDYLAIGDVWAIADEENTSNIRRTLKLTPKPRMQGEDVTLCQTLLNKHGATLETDGIFGTATDEAVKAFQTAQGLTSDGVVGSNTWNALEKDPIKPNDDGEPTEIAKGLCTWCLEHIGDVYALGGNGETATEAKIKSLDPTGKTRAIKFMNKQIKAGVTDLKLFDCSGLISRYLQNKGIVTAKRNCAHLWGMCNPIKKSELRAGDLCFRFNGSKYYHVGVYIGRGRVVESKGRDYGVVLTGIDATSGYWNDFGRLK